MKKNYLYLAAASLLMAGCAQDSFVDDNLQETTVPQEIKMSAGNRGISVEGRGVGSIGAGTDETTWNNEEIHVYAFNKNITNFATINEDNVYLNDAKAKVADDNSVQFINSAGNNITEYYPLQGAFRFVGFHTDDITLGTPTTSADDIKIPVTIDGSHDIMIAKAELSKEDKEKIFNAMVDKGVFNGAAQNTLVDDQFNAVAGGTFEETIKDEYEKAYSSYTARRNVQPNLVFTHELVRLNFYVKAGDEKTYTETKDILDTGGNVTGTKKMGVYIKDIFVNSHANGEIIIKKNGDISFNDVSSNETALNVGSKQTSGEIGDLTEIGNNKTDYTNSTATKVGEGILVMLPTNVFTNADQSQNKYYTATIETKQYYDQNETEIVADKQVRKYENVKIQKPQIWNATESKWETQDFEAGKSYDITITVYSNQAINITATLTGWVHGGGIEINPEDEYFNSSTN